MSGVLKVLGLQWIDQLKGKIVRIKRDGDGFSGNIMAIGHPTKNQWYDPKEQFEKIRQLTGEDK